MHEIDPPVYDFGRAGVMVPFVANPAHLQAAAEATTQEGVGVKVGVNLTASQLRILDLLFQNPRMVAHELAEIIGLFKRKIELNIAILKRLGRLKGVGAAQNGYWIPVTTQEGAQERVGEKVGEKVGVKLTTNQQRILDLLSQDPRMAASEMAKIIGISSRKIEQNTAVLKKLGRLRRIGPDKGGHWEVVR